MSKESLCSQGALVLFQSAREVEIRFLSHSNVEDPKTCEVKAVIVPFPLFPADETSSITLNRCKHNQRMVDLGQYAMKIAGSLA